MIVKTKPTAAFQISCTRMHLRILLHPDHPALPDLYLGVTAKFFQSTDRPHVLLTTVPAAERRSTLIPGPAKTINSRSPVMTSEGMLEIVFHTPGNQELTRIKPFHHTISDLDAQQHSTGLWLFPLPKHRRHRD